MNSLHFYVMPILGGGPDHSFNQPAAQPRIDSDWFREWALEFEASKCVWLMCIANQLMLT